MIKAISKETVVDRILSYPEGEKIQILAPIEIKKNELFADIVARLRRQGYVGSVSMGSITISIPLSR